MKTKEKEIKKTKKNLKTKVKRHTRRQYPNGICGSIIEEKNGWKSLYIYGEPFERGFAHGYLLYDDLKWVLKILPFAVKETLHTTLKTYLETSNKIFLPIVKKNKEIYDEICGISAGAKHRGVNISVQFLVAWNSLMSLYGFFKKGSTEDGNNIANPIEKCSAFIATGSATKHRDIVIGHTTHSDFATASTVNIILYVVPTTGYPFVMQTAAGYVASVTDWFISSTGMLGCETTISAIDYKPVFGNPFFCRIRKAIQYGTTLDQYVDIMLDDNAGDYACSWQFGNINTGEIMLFELGLNTHSIKRTFDGVYYGMNSAISPEVRLIETTDNNIRNIATSTGARNSRLNYLLNEKYYGKIDIHNAKKILADHYDSYENKIEMNSRSICKHTELDSEHTNRPPFYPFGCTDVKITNTKMAHKLSFVGRFGSACGRNFDASRHIKNNPVFKHWAPVLHDFPSQPYTLFTIDDNLY